ncbi:hemolysin family protein [Planococcus salinarum]|uniref:hemolysin family protein n=1 Tax=Planococcus salinarum TaxID=622695 RepID=UPI000E3DECF4|nr:hemolysin family protein [Planococcus salinarum]TAA70554.1 HlyC/CorC family transporter [Planococcus salinarum]
MDIAIHLITFFLLISTAAFFSASEYAIVKVHKSRIDQLMEDGHRNAAAAGRVLSNVDDYLSACQIGIMLSVLGLGWLGHAAVLDIITPLIANLQLQTDVAGVVAFLIAFFIVLSILSIIGELIPKTIAIHNAEKITLAIAKPLIASYYLMYGFIWLFHKASRIITGWFGISQVTQSDIGHTEEDLKLLLADSLRSGEINSSEFAFVNKIFEFDERIAKEIMVPRTGMKIIEKELTLKEVFEVPGIEKFTRYPVIDGDRDHIIGVLNMKYLLTAYIRNPLNGDKAVENFVLPVIQVIDTMPLNELLLKIQRERIHMAILRDEYGGTAGLVTIEDIIEEIVGDIQDEFDMEEVPEVQKIGDAHYIFSAKMLIDSINDILDIEIDEEDIDTIGGWIMSKSFDAIPGEKIIEQGYEFLIKEVDGHHILYLEVQKIDEAEQDE